MNTPFTSVRSRLIALDRANVDTDAILPKQYMTSLSRTGFGQYAFDNWRYADIGYPGKALEEREPIRSFCLHQPTAQGARILLGRENFGCGSSREHAVWALSDLGISVLIAPSFADIFRNNCFKNGMLPIQLSAEQIDALFTTAAQNPWDEWTVDLEACTLTGPDQHIHFQVELERRRRLLLALDDISVTEQKMDQIQTYEQQRRAQEPWLFS
ncbi:3-isopropylmalate dehydratase small subunit [Alcaligenes pakistanensis]|uniref:3-isopropylmalate dehydratase small subunit n=1 Tax=Alcaligenes pakistanensis TaxID=1482717 RepID=A0A8H9IRS9_9BURK|nr:3-isopropylmalate dehydratase small subunit [Alcaligenes pakistanensis]GHC57360.1 3-isopropylmalate dehydratase small subunit [Alcaligenes pakistanensis]